MKEVVEGFEKYWGFPQAAGAIDGTHIPIVRPQESASDYYNRKEFYSITMQAVVDFRGLLRMLTLDGREKSTMPECS